MPPAGESFFDTHCHLDFPQFAADRQEVIARARQAGVGWIAVVGADVASSRAARELACGCPEMFVATVGIHPHYAEQADAADVEEIDRLAASPEVRAIGEVGLDYFDHKRPRVPVAESARAAQRDLFRACIAVARRQGLPLVLHCRNARDDMLRIVREEIAGGPDAVIHCFSGDTEFLAQVVALGCYVSFTGTITYPNADTLRQTVAAAPLERLMIETDAPYLAPQEKRGRLNEPAYVRYVAAAIADIKGLSVTEVAHETTRNAQRFFRQDESAAGRGGRCL